jgi:hypothetical protein
MHMRISSHTITAASTHQLGVPLVMHMCISSHTITAVSTHIKAYLLCSPCAGAATNIRAHPLCTTCTLAGKQAPFSQPCLICMADFTTPTSMCAPTVTHNPPQRRQGAPHLHTDLKLTLQQRGSYLTPYPAGNGFLPQE